jgi:hypothetical protein
VDWPRRRSHFTKKLRCGIFEKTDGSACLLTTSVREDWNLTVWFLTSLVLSGTALVRGLPIHRAIFFLEKQNPDTRPEGRNRAAITGSIEGIPRGTTTFISALKKCEARAVKKQLCIENAPIDASRDDDERVFDYLHRAGIDIKLVGNSTNGFSSL